MDCENSRPQSLAGSLFTVVATVLFLMYGGYLLWVILRTGLPSPEPFLRFNCEIPAITLKVMDMPKMTWAIGYVSAALFLCAQSRQRTVGRVMTIMNVMIAASGLSILYGVYQAVAVMPGTKIMSVLGLL